MKTERKKENKPEHVLFSSYDEENSRNENSASRENAGTALRLGTGARLVASYSFHIFTLDVLNQKMCAFANLRVLPPMFIALLFYVSAHRNF